MKEISKLFVASNGVLYFTPRYIIGGVNEFGFFVLI